MSLSNSFKFLTGSCLGRPEGFVVIGWKRRNKNQIVSRCDLNVLGGVLPFALTRALRARPPEVAEILTENLAEILAENLAALQPRAQRA